MTTSTPVPPTDGAVPPPVAPTGPTGPTGAPVSGARVALAIVALALGSFAIGTTEFVTMGLLPDIAEGIDESIPTTGHIITAYAVGVVVGAPLIVSLGARLPRRELAVGLMLAVALGSAATALASGYLPVMLARLVAGLPHGAYFGVASLIAASLVRPEAQGRAISGVMVGLSVGTVAGVPASTWLGQEVGWRSAYWMVVGVGVVAAVLVLLAVPHTPGDRTATVRRELTALRRPPVLFAFGTGMIGFGGIFAMYSYVAPLLTDETGLAESAVPAFLFVFGVGSVIGSWLAGMLADWNIGRTVVGGFVVSIVALALVVPLAGIPVAVGAIVFTVGMLGSVLAIALQVRLMRAAGDAQMLGAALNHSALNIANGLGAFLGAIVIDAGYGYRAPSVVGAGLAAAGLLVFLVSLAVQRRTASAASVPA
ncbi:MFS transporter [Nocardioides zeae]|uniref:DHA1 family inner membrane transport protein n=1 Tax=Nocardioides zeae TaxID=1457234 RepID=A0AAJ1X1R5_9ACTN|nr:MFS transporter [Nocardioides zeae]MDQ1104464.1 DHA1 family inner membrane transport protein [Nocardioides zeae]